MSCYYNEHDPKAAAWLRELIKAGAIAPGDVDERSIVDVSASDVRGYTQCHWFAGIGVWSYSLRQAGWRDDRRVWTASLPCQPFSAAGKQKGFEDERHLWPVFYGLLRQSDVSACFGEQVASKAVNDWLDVVLTDLEALDFTVGAIAFPAAGVGAPHIRDRTYWVAARPGALADASRERREGERLQLREGQSRFDLPEIGRRSEIDRLADASIIGRFGRRSGSTGDGRDAAWIEPERLRDAGGLADADYAGLERRVGVPECAAEFVAGPHGLAYSAPASGPTNGFWAGPDWLLCRDGKWRPVESGTQPLAHGAPARVGRLRGYGNAICAEAARVWVETCLEAGAEA